MERIGVLETICRYPVKSMAGERIEESFVGYSGLLGDRAYAFVRAKGIKGFPWLTGREEESLLQYRPRFRQADAIKLPVDIEASFKLAPGVNPVFPPPAAFAVEVATPDGRILPIDAAELAGDLARQSGGPIVLRFSERSLYDCRPVSLFGNASVSALGNELGMAIDRRRFRANFYVDWVDKKAYRENELVGHSLQIGERMRLAILERDPRCKMITLDPETSQMDRRILDHVTAAHGGTAGVYAAVLSEGVVRSGDPIYLV